MGNDTSRMNTSETEDNDTLNWNDTYNNTNYNFKKSNDDNF